MKTKNSKFVNLFFREETFIRNRSEYTCPTCHTTFVGNVAINVVSFMCECGQILKVNKNIGDNDD